jgi:hypothetical protein
MCVIGVIAIANNYTRKDGAQCKKLFVDLLELCK